MTTDCNPYAFPELNARGRALAEQVYREFLPRLGPTANHDERTRLACAAARVVGQLPEYRAAEERT